VREPTLRPLGAEPMRNTAGGYTSEAVSRRASPRRRKPRPDSALDQASKVSCTEHAGEDHVPSELDWSLLNELAPSETRVVHVPALGQLADFPWTVKATPRRKRAVGRRC